MGEFGDIDDIEAGLGADVIIGGAAGDLIGAGGDDDDDRDIILGDEGELTFFEEVGLKLSEAMTIRPGSGWQRPHHHGQWRQHRAGWLRRRAQSPLASATT